MKKIIILMFTVAVNQLMARMPQGYGADDIKGIKASGQFVAAYPSNNNDGAALLRYHRGIYSIYGFHYDAGFGYAFHQRQPFIDFSGGMGFLFFYFDIGLRQHFFQSSATALQYGLSMQIWNNYSKAPLFYQLSLKSLHYLHNKQENSDGFIIQLSVGYRFLKKYSYDD